MKVADFGLAKLVAPGNEPPVEPGIEGRSPSLTETGGVVGTPRYMAPEQMITSGEVDHRADIYALGVVFYQMLTGELPGKAVENPSRKVRVDVRLDEIVLRALARDPERRYQQAGALKTDVETVAGGSPPGPLDRRGQPAPASAGQRKPSVATLKTAEPVRARASAQNPAPVAEPLWIIVAALTITVFFGFMVVGVALLWTLPWGGPPESRSVPGGAARLAHRHRPGPSMATTVANGQSRVQAVTAGVCVGGLGLDGVDLGVASRWLWNILSGRTSH